MDRNQFEHEAFATYLFLGILTCLIVTALTFAISYSMSRIEIIPTPFPYVGLFTTVFLATLAFAGFSYALGFFGLPTLFWKHPSIWTPIFVTTLLTFAVVTGFGYVESVFQRTLTQELLLHFSHFMASFTTAIFVFQGNVALNHMREDWRHRHDPVQQTRS